MHLNFLNYYRSGFIGFSRNLNFIKGLFYVCFWSVFDNVVFGIPITINSVECWNRTLK